MSRREEEEQATSFKVTDRRLFDEHGELRDNAPRKPAQQSPPTPVEPPPPSRPAAPPEESRPEAAPAEGEGIGFANFLMSLATSALVALGEIPDPATGRLIRHPGAARETIEILEMLQQKTRGNLTAQEGQMLDEILHDLRMKYVNMAGAAGS